MFQLDDEMNFYRYFFVTDGHQMLLLPVSPQLSQRQHCLKRKYKLKKLLIIWDLLQLLLE